MKHLLGFLLVCVSSFVSQSMNAQPPETKLSDDEVPPNFVKRDLMGWNVFFRRNIVGTPDSEMGKNIIMNLGTCLSRMDKVIPAKCREKLGAVDIWIEWDQRIYSGRRGAAAAYLPRQGDPKWMAAKSGGIEVSAVFWLIEPSFREAERVSPYWLLHEYAHAFHDRVLSFDDPKIKMAYKSARDTGLYRSVDQRVISFFGTIGVKQGWAYAMRSECEYFAELSVAYLANNNETFPHTREDLRKYDPRGFGLMQEVWGKIDR